MPLVDTRYGSLAIPDDNRDIICRFVRQYGEWAWLEVEFLAQFLPNRARLLDIGACLGTFGLGISTVADVDLLCLVEANRLITGFLRDNLHLSRAARTELIEALAVGDGPVTDAGYTTIGNIGATSFLAQAANPENTLAIPRPHASITLAELRRSFGAFDLVKLDVEGMELDVLRGDAVHLSGGHTQIWLECNESHRSIQTCDLLLSWGLEIHYFAFPSFNPRNQASDPRAIFPFGFEAGLLAAPRCVPNLSPDQLSAGCILCKIEDTDHLRRALWSTPRWGYSDWQDASREQIVALACHEILGQDYGGFLRRDDSGPVTDLGPNWASSYLSQRLRDMRQQMASEAKAAQEIRISLEKNLLEAERFAIERMAALEGGRETHRHLEQQLAAAEQKASATTVQLEVLGAQAATLAEERDLARLLTRTLQASHDDIREHASRMEQMLHATTGKLHELEHAATRLAAIEASATWRVVVILQCVVKRIPALRSAARLVVRSARAIRRLCGMSRGGQPATRGAEQAAAPVLAEVAALRGLFDPEHYLTAYPDVAASGVDPLYHFAAVGWREGRDPSSGFSTPYYLSTNDDVRAAGINPLLHYALAGQAENRQPQRRLEPLRRRLDEAVPPREASARWKRNVDRGAALDEVALRGALAGLDNGTAAGIVLSVSHDDYVDGFGGVQNVIADEASAFAAANWRYLHISPAQPLPLLADPTTPDRFFATLRLDGALIGLAALEDIIKVIGGAFGARPCYLVIHHLMGHSTEIAATLAQLSGVAGTFVWVHDFFTICSNYTLLRNDLEFCHGPPPDSSACMICTHGGERQSHWRRMWDFFLASNPTVIAPSATALALWKQYGDLPHADYHIVPPCRLELVPPPPDEGAAGGKKTLRVGFLGERLYHKGWRTFEELARRHTGDSRYLFLQLGHIEGVGSRRIRNVPVKVTASDRNAMVEAIRREALDVAIIWSIRPETFCFTAYEALAGGAFIVTQHEAGNVWPIVETYDPSRGCLADGEAGLFALFETGSIFDAVGRSRQRTGEITRGRGMADLVLSTVERRETSEA